MTEDQWLDQYTGWCEPYQARLRTSTCKRNRKSQFKCQGCKGLVPGKGE